MNLLGNGRNPGLGHGVLGVFLPLMVLVLITGCSTNGGKIGEVTVMGVWEGSELEGFRRVVAGWEEETGGKVEFEGTRGLTAVLRARVDAENPPDIAILPNPALMKDLAAAGKLQALDEVLDITQLKRDYADSWIELGSVDGELYSLLVRAASKSSVWYSPQRFAENGWEVPETWAEMVSLSDLIVEGGKTPWSIALESGAASGWPATDWVQEIFIHDHGPDLYDLWVNHNIPWTHPAVKSSFEKFGSMALKPGYVNDGITGLLVTDPVKGSHVLFEDPPVAYMYLLGSFTQGFIADEFPELKAGEGYDFFPFPSLDPNFASSITVGADMVVMLRDTPSSRSFLKYLASGRVWEPWARLGGYLSPNRSLSLDSYPNSTSAAAARQLSSARVIRIDADDLMPSSVQRAFWLGLLSYLKDPLSLDIVLQEINSVAAESYQ